MYYCQIFLTNEELEESVFDANTKNSTKMPKESRLTVLMCFSKTLDMAAACSVFSFAMTVRLLISYRELIVKSSSELR